MLEKIIERGARAGRRRVERKVLELTERMRAELPRGIEAEASDEGVRLTGRGLKRRFALDAGLRWIGLK